MRWAIAITIPALSGFLGIVVGAWLTSRRERSQRRYAFLERQLRELYSPLMELRAEIRTRGEIRTRISAAAGREWERLCGEARQSSDSDAILKLQRNRWPEFEKVAKYHDEQLAKELIPAYRRMLTVFRDNLWLAEPETRPYFDKLLEFVDLWERWLEKAIPAEVVNALGHSEKGLYPFYEHIEKKHDESRVRMSQGHA